MGKYKAERNLALKATQTQFKKRKGERDGQDERMGERNQEMVNEREKFNVTGKTIPCFSVCSIFSDERCQIC